MKIRTDFVTNSSSSSFIILAKKSIVDYHMNSINDIDRFIINQLLNNIDELSNKDLCVFEYGSGAIFEHYIYNIFKKINENDIIKEIITTYAKNNKFEINDKFWSYGELIDATVKKFKDMLEKSNAIIYEKKIEA